MQREEPLTPTATTTREAVQAQKLASIAWTAGPDTRFARAG